MSTDRNIYQQMILDHNRKPKNFRKLDDATHSSEGLNPLCGDHIWVYLKVDEDKKIEEITFNCKGCAISKASASMMTVALKGKTIEEAQEMFGDFTTLLKGRTPEERKLGPLKIFSNIWQYPSRVKCAALAWHAMSGALGEQEQVSTEAGKKDS